MIAETPELMGPAAAGVSVAVIGQVEAPFVSVLGGSDYTMESRVVVDSRYARGLCGLEYFSHIWVIYRQHRSHEWLSSRGWNLEQGGWILPPDDDRAGQGVFSSRAPCRPALLGSCIVKLLRREGNVLVVRGLDALAGTPVVDLKPYVPRFDAFPDAVVPAHWARVMEAPDEGLQLSRSTHWDTTNVDFALGVRVGLAVLTRLGLSRGDAFSAKIRGAAFFAHGFEMTTGCSPLRGALSCLGLPDDAQVRVEVYGKEASHLALVCSAARFSSAAEVFACEEASLLAWDLLTGRGESTVRPLVSPIL